MDLKPVPNLVGLLDALKSDGIPYSQVKMATMQRGYEWEKDNLHAFFNDSINELGKSYPQNTNFKGPFLGVMILTEYQKIAEDGLAPEPKTCEIVDGQQRITSSFLLISIIRDHLLRLSEKIGTEVEVDGLDGNLLYEARTQLDKINGWITELGHFLYKDLLGDKKPRLVSWPAIQPLMKVTIYKQGSHTAETGISKDDTKNKQTKRFAEAVIALRKCVEDHLGDIEANNAARTALEILLAKSASLMQLADVVLKKFYVVKLYTPNPADSAEVFLSLNSKGKALSSQDIIKASLLNAMVMTKSDQQDFAKEWSQMQKRVEDPNQFLRISWITSRNEKASPRNISSLVTKAMAKIPDVTSQKIWGEFKENARLYEALIRPKANKTLLPTNSNFTVSRLAALADVAVSYRIIALKLMSLAEPLKETEVEQVKFDEFIQCLYVLAFAGRSKFPLPQKMEDRYIELAGDLSDVTKVDETLAKLKSDLKEAIDGFNTNNLSKDMQLLVLHALEDAHRIKVSKTSIGWKAHNDSIEHTAPQKPIDIWKIELYGNASIDDSVYKKDVQNIGNLALLNGVQNSKIKRKPWINPADPDNKEESKRAAYKNADFDTTISLENIPKWTIDVVRKREAWIQSMVKTIFHPDTGSTSHYSHFI
jgi:hypothetical protein